jgi:hypothetical protein
VRKHHRRNQVALLPLAERRDLRVFGWTLDPVIPGMIVGMPVAIVLTVRLVMLVARPSSFWGC